MIKFPTKKQFLTCACLAQAAHYELEFPKIPAEFRYLCTQCYAKHLYRRFLKELWYIPNLRNLERVFPLTWIDCIKEYFRILCTEVKFLESEERQSLLIEEEDLFVATVRVTQEHIIKLVVGWPEAFYQDETIEYRRFFKNNCGLYILPWKLFKIVDPREYDDDGDDGDDDYGDGDDYGDDE